MAIVAFVVPGLFATIALPAYASSPLAADTTGTVSALADIREANAQTVEVAEVELASVDRDTYDVTSAVEIRRAQQRAAFASYSGKSAREYLANPAYPSFNLDQVVQVALQYQGVPYRFGGASPAGFDCSGFVMFVYSQFGIGLPHSSSAQGRGSGGGHIIARADALPGDIVVMDGGGHSGIYMGGNTMIHSPRPGKTVEVHNIWDKGAWFVRYGI